MAERIDFIQNREAVTFVDLFAGAGGLSLVPSATMGNGWKDLRLK